MNKLLRRLTGPLRRRWRAGGFGVHSPFAYNYIREVIRPPQSVRYYDEDLRPDAFGRLLVRIAIEAGSAGVATVAASAPPEPGHATYIAYRSDIEALTAMARQEGRGVVFVSPLFAIYCRRSHVPFHIIEVAMPRPPRSCAL